MTDQGIKLSDDRTRQLMARLEEVYTEAYETAIANNKKAIAKYASLTDEALKNLDDEAKKLKREAFANEIKRTEGLKNQIAAEIAEAGKTAAKIIQGEMTGIYGLNYDFAAFDIQKQAGLNLSFTQYDRNQLAVLVSEGQSPFTKIAYKKLGDDTEVVRRLQNQFIQGIMNGESQRKLMQRIKAVTGQSKNQAKRVAQTERNRVQSQGRNQAIHEANEMGVETERQWHARMFNTRDAHVNLNGETAKNGEMFKSDLGDIEFPGDPKASAANVINCHCFIQPKVKSVSPALARHRALYDFEDAKTIKEAETYANTVLGIPNVDFKGVDIRYANEWNKALADSLIRFPELKDNIKFTGTAQARNRLRHEENRQNTFLATKAKYPNVSDADIWSAIDKQLKKPEPIKPGVLAQSVSSGNFSGVAINKNDSNYDDIVKVRIKGVTNKWFPVGTESPRSILDHEIGHQIDTMLDISNKSDIIKLYNSLSKQEITDGLSSYSWNNDNPNPIREFVAEGWSEYVNSSQPREIAKKIGKTIEREYALWKK